MEHSSPIIHTMINAAKKAGKSLLRDFIEIERGQVSSKSIKSFVGISEKRSEETIINNLMKFHPEFNFISEGTGKLTKFSSDGTQNTEIYESGNPIPENTWIIDPLDGTNNFSRGFPFFAISIALYGRKDITAGIIYDPLHDHIYMAEKGQGAYRNNLRLRIGACKSIENSMCLTSLKNPSCDKLFKNIKSVRMMGCTSLGLSYVASGFSDIYIDAKCKIWDIAAGVLIVKESGGMVDDLFKKQHVLDSGAFIASNHTLFSQAREFTIYLT